MTTEETTHQNAGGAVGASMSGVALHELVREKRREAGLSQQDLARRAGVMQSALSTYERRGPEAQALSADNIREVAEILGIAIDESEEVGRSRTRFSLHYCPEPDCPSVISYPLDNGRVGYRPRFIRAPSGRPLYCTDCGEICERNCPGCGADVSSSLHGAFCPSCGAAYIDGGILTAAELDRRQRFRQELSSRSEVVDFRHLSDLSTDTNDTNHSP